MIKKVIGIVLLPTLIFSTSIVSIADEAVSEESVFVEAEADTEEDDVSNLVDWDNMFVSLNGVRYDFLIPYSELEKNGWVASEKILSHEMEPLKIDYGYIKNNAVPETGALFWFVNQSVDNAQVRDCYVNGFDIGDMFCDLSAFKVELPGGIILGESTIDDMHNVYGEEDEVTPSALEGRTVYAYTDGGTSTLAFDTDDSTGVLTEVIYNNSAIADIVEEKMTYDFTENQLSYTKLTELGSDYDSYRIQIGDLVYPVPIPVAEVLADGWEPLDTDDTTILTHGEEEYVRFIKDGAQFIACVTNIESEVCPIGYAWITSVEVSSEDAYVGETDEEEESEEESEVYEDSEDPYHAEYIPADVSIPGGIKIGMLRDEFTSILEANGVPYADEEEGIVKSYFIENKNISEDTEGEEELDNSEEYEEDTFSLNTDNYFFANQTYGNTYKVSIYTGDDGAYPKDSIVSISVINNPLLLESEELETEG